MEHGTFDPIPRRLGFSPRRGRTNPHIICAGVPDRCPPRHTATVTLENASDRLVKPDGWNGSPERTVPYVGPTSKTNREEKGSRREAASPDSCLARQAGGVVHRGVAGRSAA